MTLKVRTRFQAWLDKILGVEDYKRKQEAQETELAKLYVALRNEQHLYGLTKELLRLRDKRIAEYEREIARLTGVRHLRLVDSYGSVP